MEIQEGEFEYEYFNFCYLHNMLSLIIYSLYHNKYPEICVNRGKENVIQWEWYFEPLIDRKKSVTKVKKTLCNKKNKFIFTEDLKTYIIPKMFTFGVSGIKNIFV